MSREQRNGGAGERSQTQPEMPSQQDIYIYAEVDIDKAYHEVLGKSRRLQAYLHDVGLGLEFTEKMRQLKNFRICFDHVIQGFIHRKELSSDLRLIKKPVFNSLEEFIQQRYRLFLEEERLNKEYRDKVEHIEKRFARRFQELMDQVQ